MTVHVDLHGLLAGAAGAGGLEPADLDAVAAATTAARAELTLRRARGALPFAELAGDRDALAPALEAARDVADRIDTLVVLGIGGSATGPLALAEALGGAGRVRVLVSDAIDPASVRELLGSCDLRRTLFNVVSKSGDTAETMARFLLVRDRLMRELGAVDYKRHLVVTTEAQRGSLRQIVNDEGFQALDVPADVDGRYLLLGAPGLFPLAVAGVDVDELLAGASWMDERIRAAESARTDPALGLAGALHALAVRRGARLLVVMPYGDRLVGLADWICESFNETLGKARDGAGRTLGTAVRARGTADQHASCQRWLEGPADAVVLFLRVEDHGEPLDIPAAYQDIDEVGCLGGNSLGTLLNGAQRATELALARRGRPSATITLPALTPFTVGQLVVLAEWVTVASALLAGVEPFGQPAIEDLKQWTFGLLGRPGFEARRAEMEAWIAQRDPRFVL